MSVSAALTFQLNVLDVALMPDASVIRTVTLLNVCAPLVIVPVIRPLPLMLNVAGPVTMVYVHGVFQQDDVNGRLIVAPTVVVWFAGAVMVGAALTVQVNVLDGALTLAASVIRTVKL